MRITEQEIAYDTKNKCFICGISREVRIFFNIKLVSSTLAFALIVVN